MQFQKKDVPCPHQLEQLGAMFKGTGLLNTACMSTDVWLQLMQNGIDQT